MRMPIGNLPQVIAEYFESVILPAASAAGGVAPFAAGVVEGLVVRQAPAVAAQYTPMLQALGVIDAEGKVDIDLLHEEAAKAIEKSPFVIAGYKPDRGDIDRLKAIMEKYGG